MDEFALGSWLDAAVLKAEQGCGQHSTFLMLPHRSFANRMHTFNSSRDGTPQAAGPQETRARHAPMGAAASVPTGPINDVEVP